MPLQRREIFPPTANDKDLSDFAEVVRGNLEDLFDVSHIHDVKTGAPADAEGVIGSIQIRSVSGAWYIYAKVAANTWKRVALS